MARLTITLSDEIHRALKEASAERNRTIGELVEESLECYGIRSREQAAQIVARVRAASSLDEDEALRLALAETAHERRR
ncbi:MAG: CopG family transcriptional regulator [Acidobacteriota bacterium]